VPNSTEIDGIVAIEIQGMNPTKTLADFKFELDEYCLIQEELKDLLTESEEKDLPSQIDLLNPDQLLYKDRS
jgi:hypothetical protein